MASLALLLYPPSRPARLGPPASAAAGDAAALGGVGAAACAAGRLVCTVMRGFTVNLALGAAGFTPPPAPPSAPDASGFRGGGAGTASSSRRCTCPDTSTAVALAVPHQRSREAAFWNQIQE